MYCLKDCLYSIEAYIERSYNIRVGQSIPLQFTDELLNYEAVVEHFVQDFEELVVEAIVINPDTE